MRATRSPPGSRCGRSSSRARARGARLAQGSSRTSGIESYPLRRSERRSAPQAPDPLPRQPRRDGRPQGARRRGPPAARAQAAVVQGPGAGREALPRAERADQGGQPPHGLPGGRLPEHRRVLGARHGHVHDPRRHVHAALRLLQRPDRQADVERPARARARRAPGRADGPAPRGHHERRPRRPARQGRERVRRRDPADPPPGAVLQGRGPHPRLPGLRHAAREGHRRAARRLQPQRRGRPAALPRRAPRLEVAALAPRAAQRRRTWAATRSSRSRA